MSKIDLENDSDFIAKYLEKYGIHYPLFEVPKTKDESATKPSVKKCLENHGSQNETRPE
jgi:hypothetical protein